MQETLKRAHLTHAALWVAALICPAAAARDSTPTPKAESIPLSALLGFESVKLPQGERMGLVGASVLFQVSDSFFFGPAAYGAATGRRGGLFVGGAELQYRTALGGNLALAVGLYAGGGGGAAAPVGGGLMLRPAASLLYTLTPAIQIGVSASVVKFSSGQINSRQIGLVLAWRDEFRHHPTSRMGLPLFDDKTTGLGFDRMLATVGTYRYRDTDSDGRDRRIGLIGARADHRFGASGLTLGMESGAAATGGAAGYMELLGSVGWGFAPLPSALPSLRIGTRFSLGLGGGGAVPTGGGSFAKAAATLEWRADAMPGWTVGLESGHVQGLNGTLRANSAQAWVAMDLEPARRAEHPATGSVNRHEWTGGIQRFARAHRRDGSVRPLDTVSLKLTRSIGSGAYLTGQAHSAYAGGAGAYSVGLVGLGVATRADAGPRVGLEALVGAAGGGGVATSGGAVAQGLLWAGLGSPAGSEWRVGLGGLRSLKGELRSPILEVSWTKAFGLAGR